jgi:hypothetical protein
MLNNTTEPLAISAIASLHPLSHTAMHTAAV